MSQITGNLFRFKDDHAYERLRNVFGIAGYNDGNILETLGVKNFPSIRGTDVPLLMRRTEQQSALNTLIRLFLMEVPVSMTAAKRAFDSEGLSACTSAGLLLESGGEVIARIKILPFKGLLVAFDQNRMLLSAEKARYVMGIGASSLTLANLTIRKHAGRTLDLGTGCGIQALLAAQHSDRVIASDKNPRAAGLAAFNARLNGLGHLHCLVGNLFEPFCKHQFDLIVTNPPFVISPETRYIYRDGGMPADHICRTIVREVPKFLTDGGYCQMLCNWAETADNPWEERLREWFDGTGCDVWVLRSESRDAATYADTWIRHTEPGIGPEAFAERFDAWMQYYRTQGIEAVSAGLITMKREAGKLNHFRAEDGPEKMIGPCGKDIQLGFSLRNFLSSIRNNNELFETMFQIAPHVRLVREAVPGETGWTDESFQLQLTQGLAYKGNVDPFVANLVVGCNGKQPLKTLLAQMATQLGVDAPEKIAEPVSGVVRELVARGFLLPGPIND
ncbi:MAG: class I SAM-dependent methyltransferase [Desulfobacterales bacterium]|jgi:hypothetical protein|nr:class I SAM-dependent methyltransferase [Desulfobacterales bacterium]